MDKSITYKRSNIQLLGLFTAPFFALTIYFLLPETYQNSQGQTYSAYPLEGSPHPIIFSTFSTIESQCSFEYLLDNSANIIYQKSRNIVFIDLAAIQPFYIS